MHVPTAYNVINPIEGGREHGRLGIECFPTRNYTGTVTIPSSYAWIAAIGYLSDNSAFDPTPMDRYRVAYYISGPLWGTE
jgi:hypothetical protein